MTGTRALGRTAAVAAMATLFGASLAGAPADAAEGLYIGGGLGLNYHEDADVEGPFLDGDIELDLGYAILGVVGYSFDGPRIEGELSYRNNGTNEANLVNTAPRAIDTSPDGQYETVALMANAYYDIGTGTFVTPYLGVGVGGAYADYDDIGDDIVFAYQGIVGASFALDDNLEAFVDYRYFATTDVDGGKIGRAAEIDNRHHTLMAGLRYNFGPLFETEVAAAPTPAPAPPPVQRPALLAETTQRPPAERQFMVFFDFDSAQIGVEGGRIVRDAAEASRVVAVTRIDLTGHADRAGPAAYNDRLSRRRAMAVMRALVAEGVPEKDIVIYARGEREPLVPTRDGVREPKNRRVEIVLN